VNGNITTPGPAEGQPPVAADARRLLDQLAVSRAAELARARNFTNAEALLRDLTDRSDPSVEALDLQARIYAQQGKLGEAERHWRKVLDITSSNSAARAGLAWIGKMQSRSIWLDPARLAATWGVCIVVFLAVLGTQLSRDRALNAQMEQRVLAAMQGHDSGNGGDLNEVLTNLSTLSSHQAAAAQAQGHILRALAKIENPSQSLVDVSTSQHAILVQLHRMQHQEAADRRQLALIRELLERDLGRTVPSVRKIS